MPDGLRQLPAAFVQVALLKVMFESDAGAAERVRRRTPWG